MSQLVRVLAAAAILAFSAFPTAAQYPARPIRVIVAQAPGSGVDLMARMIGQKLTESWGQQIVVDNRPGANGIIGMEAAARSKPDGYNLILAVPSALTMNPYVYKKLPYDTFRDYAPITQTATNTFGLIVNPALPALSVKELVALAKARRGEVIYGSFGVGNQTHLAGELFASQIGLKMLHVPYKGETPAVTELISGQVMLMFTPMQGTAAYVRAGRLRLLATCGVQRSASFPDVPSMTELGYPSVVITGWTGLLGPAGIPSDIVSKLHQEVSRHVLSAEFREQLLKQGSEPVGSAPAEFAAFIKSEAEKWSVVIKQAGLAQSQ